MSLRILILGQIPEDLRKALLHLDDGVELLEPASSHPDPPQVRSLGPHLVVLGRLAPLTTLVLSTAYEDPVPVLSTTGDPAADLRLPDDGLGREEVLRLARRLARMQKALTSRPRGDEPMGMQALWEAMDLFHKRLEYEFSRALRHRHPVSLVTLSVDGRERLDSNHGDAAVREFVSTLTDNLSRCVRDGDLLFCSNDNEIAAILPETNAAGATIVAERFLTQASRLVFKPAQAADRPMLPFKVTTSIGVADGPREGVGSSRDLLGHARQSMVAARAAGGGRIVVHGLEPGAVVPAG